MQTAPYDARAIANFLLDEADKRGKNLTQLELLKIIYFAHGWYLVRSGRPLVEQQFECWKYGPVLKVVRDNFAQWKAEPIKSRAERLDIYTGVFEPVCVDIDQADREFIVGVFDEYHGIGAWGLSDLTHEKGSPWDRVWNANAPMARFGLRIKNEEIKSYFSAMARRQVSH